MGTGTRANEIAASQHERISWRSLVMTWRPARAVTNEIGFVLVVSVRDGFKIHRPAQNFRSTEATQRARQPTLPAIQVNRRGGSGSVHADGMNPQPSMFHGKGLGRRRGQSGALEQLRAREAPQSGRGSEGAVHRLSRVYRIDVVAENRRRCLPCVGSLANRTPIKPVTEPTTG
ncbi:hypothetical protein CCHR01_15235 [Colletotrichum chrysophilum]|uniref:Uncharacterized protein n=1 Tax=Colletotrichum chrysophilum TaxID=1836956 RepID=A0AAD9A5Z7_9PEZI|nr:hypothetical protein CCHR01_15235 [Colletotrichum chrysophilum]